MRRVKVFHFLFADDTLILCKNSKEHVTFLCWLLMCFEALLGLKNNLEKSELIPIGDVEGVEALAAELGCRVRNLPTTYLGLLLGARYKSVGIWDKVEEHSRRRLAMRKKQYISKGVRLHPLRA